VEDRAETIVVLWFLAGLIGALVKSVAMRLRIFTGLCVWLG